MKKFFLLLLAYSTIANCQIIDSIPSLRYKIEKGNMFIENTNLFNNLLKKEIEKRKDIIFLEKKINIQFCNIETILMVYSFSEKLKLSNEDKKAIESLFISYSNILIENLRPTHISISREENYISPVATPVGREGKIVSTYLIGFKKDEFINEKNVKLLIDLFNDNTEKNKHKASK